MLKPCPHGMAIHVAARACACQRPRACPWLASQTLALMPPYHMAITGRTRQSTRRRRPHTAAGPDLIARQRALSAPGPYLELLGMHVARGLQNHVFSQVFCLLGGFGGSKTICFYRFSAGGFGCSKTMCVHRFSASWEVSGASTPYVFIGFLPHGRFWGVQKTCVFTCFFP